MIVSTVPIIEDELVTKASSEGILTNTDDINEENNHSESIITNRISLFDDIMTPSDENYHTITFNINDTTSEIPLTENLR